MEVDTSWILTGLIENTPFVLILILIFSPLERLFSIHTQPILRPKLWVDFAFLWGQFLLWGSGTVIVLLWVQAMLHDLEWIQWIHFHTQNLHTSVLIVVGVMLSDFCIYWGLYRVIQYWHAFRLSPEDTRHNEE